MGSGPGAKELMEHGFTWLHGLPIPEHVATAVLVALLLLVFALRVRSKLADTEAALQPEDGVTARNVGEVVVETISGIAEGVIGHNYERCVPLLAAFFVFILLANLLGLVPGFVPPTSNFNTTLALGLVSFLAYNAYGIQEHGVGGHFRELLGPVIWIAPLMLVVELFSHAFRPISLGIRLFANMFADHEVVSIFTSLTKLVIPVMFYVLGAFVCVVQAFVFTMLSAIYISLATAHDH
jgi:F-type H+-transporting ATPase subunit a